MYIVKTYNKPGINFNFISLRKKSSLNFKIILSDILLLNSDNLNYAVPNNYK